MVSGAGILLDPRYQKILKTEDISELKKTTTKNQKTNTQFISVYTSQLKEMKTKNKQTKYSTKKKKKKKNPSTNTPAEIEK